MWNRSLKHSRSLYQTLNQSVTQSVKQSVNHRSIHASNSVKSDGLFSQTISRFSNQNEQSNTENTQLNGLLTLEDLRSQTREKSINQVILGFPDMYGRLMGKRFDSNFFLQSIGCPVKSEMKGQKGVPEKTKQKIDEARDEPPHNPSTHTPKIATGACNYLLGCDMEMIPIKNLKFFNWEKGFGDFHLMPDFSSMRNAAWCELQSKQANSQPITQIDPKADNGTGSQVALVVADLYDDDHNLITVAPRTILRKQIDQANQILNTINTPNNQANKQSGKQQYQILAASELEYYTFEESYKQSNKQKYSNLTPVGYYFEDYHLLQTAREEFLSSQFRHYLTRSGIEVESSKGECGLGQHELNIKYAEVLSMADQHTVYKQCLKEVADSFGKSVTFMAKPFTDSTGSGCHLHLSIVDSNGDNAFKGDIQLNDKISCSPMFLQFLAGWLKYLPETMPFYAPTVNSYKRFVSSSWAPTSLTWSYDNRTAGFRVVGKGQSLRIECRIAGADVNIYLAFAAAVASGMRGIKEKLEPPPMFTGNSYDNSSQEIKQLPKSLGEAAQVFEKSAFAREVFGDDVVDHYATFYKSEQEAFDRHVADWERTRYFERI